MYSSFGGRKVFATVHSRQTANWRCASCGHPLTGLPVRHRCPECGVEYGANPSVFGEPRITWLVLTVVNWLVVAAFAVIWLLGKGHEWNLWAVVTCALMGAGWTWHLRSPRHAVVVSDTELTLVRGYGDAVAIPLARIENVRWSVVYGDVEIEDSAGRILGTISRRFLGSARTTRRLTSELRSRIASVTGSRSHEGNDAVRS